MMLKLTLADWDTQTDGERVFVNPAHIWHIKRRTDGAYVHLGGASTGHGFVVRESAEEVARMMEVQRMQQASQDHWLHELAVAYDAPALNKDQRRVMANLMSRIQAKLEEA